MLRCIMLNNIQAQRTYNTHFRHHTQRLQQKPAKQHAKHYQIVCINANSLWFSSQIFAVERDDY